MKKWYFQYYLIDAKISETNNIITKKKRRKNPNDIMKLIQLKNKLKKDNWDGTNI